MADEWDVMPKAVKAPAQEPAKVKPQTTFAIAAALVVVFGLGILLGRLTASQSNATTVIGTSTKAHPTNTAVTKERAELAWQRWNCTTDLRNWLRQGFKDRPREEWDVEAARNKRLAEEWIDEAAKEELKLWNLWLESLGRQASEKK